MLQTEVQEYAPAGSVSVSSRHIQCEQDDVLVSLCLEQLKWQDQQNEGAQDQSLYLGLERLSLRSQCPTQ